jgi:hypothetical protein
MAAWTGPKCIEGEKMCPGLPRASIASESDKGNTELHALTGIAGRLTSGTASHQA